MIYIYIYIYTLRTGEMVLDESPPLRQLAMPHDIILSFTCCAFHAPLVTPPARCASPNGLTSSDVLQITIELSEVDMVFIMPPNDLFFVWHRDGVHPRLELCFVFTKLSQYFLCLCIAELFAVGFLKQPVGSDWLPWHLRWHRVL